MKPFDNEWLCDALERHPSFFTKRMFGGLAVYVFDRLMMILVQPTKTGRWTWHGVLVCTDHARHPGIVKEFPALAPHDVLRKWLFIDTRHPQFEPTMERVAGAIAKNDGRFGITPTPRGARRTAARPPATPTRRASR